MYTLCLLNQKGGVGKTALTANLGGALAELGYRVLLIDFDPQGHLTSACGLDTTVEPHTMSDALLSDHTPDLDTLTRMVRTWRPNLDVITTNLNMFLVKRQLHRVRAPEQRLNRIMEVLEAADLWDVCLIDCPPDLDVLTDNALVTAGRVLIPVESEDSTLHALKLLLNQVGSMQGELRIKIDVLGMVVNKYDPRKGYVVTSTLETLQEMPIPILGIVRDRSVIREAWRAGVPVVEHAPTSAAADMIREVAGRLVRIANGETEPEPVPAGTAS